jgi:hypothetical protein
MGRPGPRRVFVGVRLDPWGPTGRPVVQTYADRETGGNLSAMIRLLITEALKARSRRASVTHHPTDTLEK